ncbi:ribosomal maturation YjgA family protein [Streptomyces sp. NPDC055663]
MSGSGSEGGVGVGGGGARTALRARAVAAGAAAATVLAGLGVRAFMDGDLAKYAGDALYTVLICALAAVIAPGARPVVTAGAGLTFSWAVELLQLTGVPAELSRHSTVARLVLGSTFNAPDLLWYAVGAGFAWAVTALATSPASPGSVPRTSASRRPRRHGR